MAFFGAVGCPSGSLAASPEGGDPGSACQVVWAVPRARGGSIQGQFTSHRAPLRPSHPLLWSVFAHSGDRAVSWGGCQLLPATGGCGGVGDVEQGGTDGNLEGELCNCRTTEAEGTSGGYGEGPSLTLDEAAQGPVQSSYLQGW